MSQLLPHKRLGNQGPWLFLVHGYMVDGGMFMPVEGALAQHYRVVIPDLRGYGSAWNWPGPYTLLQRAQDVLALVDALTQGEPVWVFGYSMGGVIAQLMARDAPKRVQGLILGCTFAYKNLTALERLQRQLLPRALRLMPPSALANLLYPQAFGSEDFPPEVIEWYKKALQRTRLEVLLADAQEIFSIDLRPYLSKLEQPALVIGGGSDLIVPPEHSKILAEKLPHSQLIIYPGAGHALIFTHRRPLVRDMHRFILSAARTAEAPNLHSAPSQSPLSQPQ